MEAQIGWGRPTNCGITVWLKLTGPQKHDNIVQKKGVFVITLASPMGLEARHPHHSLKDVVYHFQHGDENISERGSPYLSPTRIEQCIPYDSIHQHSRG